MQSTDESGFGDSEDKPPEADLLRRRRAADVIALPLYRTAPVGGVYDEGTIDFIKELRADGIPISWADEPDQRSFKAKRSAEIILTLILAVPTGVVGNAAWAGLVRLFRRPPRSSGHVHLEIIRESRPDGTVLERLNYEGTGAEVAVLLQRALPEGESSSRQNE